MPVALFLCPMVEEPFRGGTRRRPSVMCIPNRPGRGHLTIAEDLGDMALVAIDAPQDELDKFLQHASVKQVVDIQADADIPAERKAQAAGFETSARDAFSRKAR